MKFFKLFFAAVMLFFANNIWAYNFSAVHNGTTIYYNITSNSSPYTVEVTYRTTTYNSYSGSITIPDSVTYNGITYSVTSIGRLAFYGCTGLTSITIPNTVTSIGSGAFNDSCINLTRTNYTGTIAQWCDIDFYDYDSNPVYYSRNLYTNNQLVTNLVIPNTVDTINKYAFCCDTCITSVTIPNSVKHIGDYVFAACTGISTLNFNPDSCTMGNRQIQSVFARCTNLRALNIGNNVRLIPDYAFSETGLTSVTIPDSVRSIGNSAFSGCTGLTSVTIGNSVTKIGNSAFYGCTGLTSVTIGNSVTKIGSYAFYYCPSLRRTNYIGTIAQWCDIDFYDYDSNPVYYSRNLYTNNQLVTNLVIPNTVDTINKYAFCGDTCITSVTIPNYVTCIGNSVFSGCTGLTSVTIPNSVTCIGEGVFSGCAGLTSVTIPNSVTSIGNSAFYGCAGLTSVTIPNSVTRIGNSAFYNCTGLSTVNFNADSCVSMGAGAFSNCTNFRTLIIGNNVRYIPSRAFLYCSALDSVTIGNSVTNIGQGAFCGCSGLTLISIPNSIVRIDTGVFSNCTGLTSVTIPNSVTRLCASSFLGCSGLTSVTIPNSVISIENGTFSGCTSLNTITIPDSVNSISANVFYGCTGLTSVTIPNSITSIGYRAFFNCSNLTMITIPSSVSNIEDNAFNNCSGLTSITFRRANTTIGNNNFNSLPVGLPIHIPCGSSAWYINKLPNFSNFIEELQYSYSVTSQDTIKGTVATITAPTCNTPSWTIRATANTGYTFSHWSDGDTQNPRTITVTQDTALVAYFTANTPQWYRFSVVSEDTLKGTVQIITQPTQANPQAIIMATANNGYTFYRWSDGNTQNPRSLIVTQDTALVAYFTANTPQWYRFSVVSEDTLKGTVQIITQPSQANPQAIIMATANNGYTFTHWSDGNTQNPRSLTVTQDTALVAYFRWYDFIVSSEDTAKGTVQVLTQPSQSNPQATFIALPNTGYTFSRWSDGNTQNPRSVTVTQDTILIAFFTSNQGIAEAEGDAIRIYPNPASDKVTLEGIGNEADIFIINAMGKVVRRLENAGGTITFSVGDLPKGIYFVRVGNAVRKLAVE